MKNQVQKSTVSKPSMVKKAISILPMAKKATSLLPTVKKMVNKKMNQIKSSIMGKIMPNKLKKIQNTPKRVSKRGIKSLENYFSVKATKDIINTPKIVTDEFQIVTKPEVVTLPKIVSKPEIAPKPKKS